ncbi:MAG TPA: biotin/lipoyl-containing protein, partial [Candidimonas sp.]|nr:biotin/lipoyl-containing protein [Candidimonas sp.]
MGIHIIKTPDIGEGIAEVELVEWHVQPGDDVVEDQLLADVMTDKATVQVPSPMHGKVVSLGGAVGEVMAVGSELIRLDVEGEGNVSASSASARSGRAAVADAPAPATTDVPAKVPAIATRASVHDDAEPEAAVPSAVPVRESAPAGVDRALNVAARPDGGKPLASPAVRKRAWDLGIELQYVVGTGPAGRISHSDLDAYLARGTAVSAQPGRHAAYASRSDEQAFPVIGLRR